MFELHRFKHKDANTYILYVKSLQYITTPFALCVERIFVLKSHFTDYRPGRFGIKRTCQFITKQKLRIFNNCKAVLPYSCCE